MIKKLIQKLFNQSDKHINFEKVKEAITDYREEGKILMTKLGEKFNLDIENAEDFDYLTSRGNTKIPRRGKLSKNWKYNFHGTECGFYNSQDQQKIEVVLSNPPKFGHVDSWFLLSYMQTTQKYKSEIIGIKWQDLKTVVEKLYLEGEIEEVVR